MKVGFQLKRDNRKDSKTENEVETTLGVQMVYVLGDQGEEPGYR